ncbi:MULTISPECIES: transglycosylase family protein [Mycolicibacterium]|uniref:Uncharacterized protein n=1 Tax=Mycolicibacterium wolinskyi TaxID=59750 RepID=A0A1X2EW20_9MYCO|nr:MULTISPECIES: transglycosylase family protein [Mycolicibacterium]ORX09949.1 hypothetical protein AWC31_07055 [Mycolicibacterium wolinskyi]
MATRLAAAYIDVRVTFSNAMDDIVRNAERAGDEAERRLKRKFKDGIEVDVDADTSEAEAKITKTTRDRTVNVGVDVDTRGAETTLDRLTRRRGQTVNLRANVDIGDAGRQLGILTRGLENVARSDIFRVGLGVGLIGSIPSMVYGLTEVAAAMQKVAQAGIALPGILAGIGASFGTLLGGLSGIGDAFEAVVAANKEMASGQTNSAAAARSAQSAQNNLRNALVEQERATGNLSDAYRSARRNLEDLQTQMRGGAIDAKQAALDVQVAWENLNSGNYADRRQAVIDYEQAVQREAEVTQNNIRTQEDYAVAQAKGIEGSDQVVAANEAIIQSNQQVADALAQVAENTNKTSTAQQKANDLLGELSPNGQALVNSLTGIYDQVIDLRNNISQTMLEGVPDGLEGLFAKALPHVNAGTQKIAGRWNAMIHEMLNVLGTDENMSLVDRIFGNTDEAMARLQPAIDPLVNVIGTLTGTGSDFLPRIADALGSVLTRFDAFITRASENGDLKRWIDEGLTAVGDLGGIALNIAKMVGAFTSAADGNFLGWLRDVTDRWATFLNSTEGQQQIRDFLQQGKATLNEWRPILEGLPGLFMDIVEVCRDLLNNVILPVAKAISDMPGGIEAVAGAFALWKGAQVLGVIGDVANMLGMGGGGKGGVLGNLTKISSLVRVGGPIALGLGALLGMANELHTKIKEDDEYVRRQADPSIPQEQKDKETTERFGVGRGDLGQIPEPGSLLFEQMVADIESGKTQIPGINPKDARKALERAYEDQKSGKTPPTGPDKHGNIPGTQIPWAYPETPPDQLFPGAPGFQTAGPDQWPTGDQARERRGSRPRPAPGTPGAAIPPGTKFPDAGLTPGAAAVNDLIGQYFPEITTIGGYRKDPHPDHPSGRALDIMIPGGTTAGGANPSGKALGDRIWEWMKTTGLFDMRGSLWQTMTGGNHFDHIHARLADQALGGIPGTVPGPGQSAMPSTGGVIPVFVINWPNGGGGGFTVSGSTGPGGTVHQGTNAAPGPVGPSLWDEVAKYESSGNWSNADTGQNGHYGGLQFSPETWNAYGGQEFAAMPHLATREQQIEIANRTAFTGHGDTKPQGLGAWEVITKGLTPNITTSTPQSSFMPPAAPKPHAPQAPGGSSAPSGPLMPPLPPSTANVDMAGWRQQIAGGPVPGRKEGLIPAAAGHSGQSGNSFLSGIYDMGAQAINGVIDQAASMASSAASMGVNAIAPGAGGAAGGAAQFGISMGTQAAKRGVQYVADLAGIWTDALIEQATPFGAPRWISTDPTAFMPTGLMDVASSIPPLPSPQVPGGPASGPGGEFDPASGGISNDYSVHNHNVTTTDVKKLAQENKDQQTLQMMRHSGRP